MRFCGQKTIRVEPVVPIRIAGIESSDPIEQQLWLRKWLSTGETNTGDMSLLVVFNNLLQSFAEYRPSVIFRNQMRAITKRTGEVTLHCDENSIPTPQLASPTARGEFAYVDSFAPGFNVDTGGGFPGSIGIIFPGSTKHVNVAFLPPGVVDFLIDYSKGGGYLFLHRCS